MITIARGLGIPQFTDHATALAFLRRVALEPDNLSVIRRTMGSERGLAVNVRDEDLLRDLAWRMVRGELHVLVPALLMRPHTTAAAGDESDGAAEESEAPPPATAPMRDPEPDPEDAAVLGDECDAQTQAEALTAASESGAALCEV